MPLTSTDLEQLVKNLDSKERFYLADRLLSTLNSTQLLSLIDQAERVIKDLKLKKETSVLFDIRKINNNSYADIKRLGQDYPNLYLGLMRFLKGKTYKITHKLSDTKFVVRGLGLEQEGLKTYLNIEFLLPEQVVRKYLFYDGGLDISRIPQQIDIEKLDENINSTEGQTFISAINEGKPESNRLKNTVAPRKDWSAIFNKKDWIVEEIKPVIEEVASTEEQEQAKPITSKPKIFRKEPIDEKQLPSVRRSKKLSINKSSPPEQKVEARAALKRK